MGDARFATLSASEMRQDLTEFVADLSAVNPAVRVILTVSPVPPAVSWQPRHILIAAHSVLAAMQAHPLGRDAAIIGEVTADHAGFVLMRKNMPKFGSMQTSIFGPGGLIIPS